ncbi:alanine racemase [Geminocystis sp. GBBB08]|uniref:alanine racemase n=1 Tax=Geminocystis sp. GBBB08 TaxID=2604140 RepID=UPI0027E376B0|nr:alanine racemase [Geminocystis sp. GBBB08]MBL1210929.1 alanine racemase [Geminocystis sp. GBBB08]
MTIVTVNYFYSQNQQQRAWLNINHQALINNVKALKAFLNPETHLMAVIKADAYGHGAVKVAKTLLNSGVDSLAIATLSEGIALREAGITASIMILGAINTADEVKDIVKYNLEPTLCTPSQALIFAQTLHSLNATLPVHLKLDTGMSRLGTHWYHAVDFVKYIQQFPPLHLSSIYSHLATADDVNTSMMELQHSRFQEAISALKTNGINIPILHLANSAGTLSHPQLHYDMVRVGLALYGISPAPHLKDKVNLQPVLEVKARITQIKTLPPHTGVSYSHTFKCDRPIKMAVVGIGYADGIPRLLSNKMKVIIQGKFADQIGNITMDQIMLNVTDFPDLEVGEIVTLLGKEKNLEITADDWANTIGTISWEILCSFKHRLPRVNIFL